MKSTTLLRAVSPLLSAAFLLGAAPGLTAQGAPKVLGELAGMTAYEFEGVEGIWLMTPDQETIINGMVYDLSGDTPVVNFGTADPSDVPEFLRRPEPAHESETAKNHPEPTSPEDFISHTLAEAQAGLEGVAEERQRELLVDLVSRMDQAKTPEEFRLTILEWQAEIQGDEEALKAARQALEEIRAQEESALSVPKDVPDRADVDALAERISKAIPGTVTEPAPRAMEGAMVSYEAAPALEEADSMSDKEADGRLLIDQMRHEGFWFAVGAAGAPTVYAVIDPTCPYCARAIKNLKPEIDNGDLQLRVLLAPVISRAAPPKIAGILTSEDPVEAFLTHEIEYAERGASSIDRVDFGEMPLAMQEGVKANYDIVFEHGLPGVPFFGYETPNGMKFLSGVPQPGHFRDALPDRYTGTSPSNP